MDTARDPVHDGRVQRDDFAAFLRSVRTRLAGAVGPALAAEGVGSWRRLGRDQANAVVGRVFERAGPTISEQYERVLRLAIDRPWPRRWRAREVGTVAVGGIAAAEGALTFGTGGWGIVGGTVTAIMNGLIETYLAASILVHRHRDAGREPSVEDLKATLARTWANPKELFSVQGRIAGGEFMGALLDRLRENVTEELVGSVFVVGASVAAVRRAWAGLKMIETAPLDQDR